MLFALDDLGLGLSLAETILLVAGLIFYAWATIVICRDPLLHINFRLNLCIILFGSVLIPLRRLPTLYWRVFLIGEAVVPFIGISNDLMMVSTNLQSTAVLAMSLERILHTNCKRFSESGLIGRLAILGLLIVSNGLLFVQRRFAPSVIFSLSFLIAAPIISLVLLIFVFRANLRKSNAVSDLNSKAEAIWGMKAVRIFLPAMAVTSVLNLSIGCLGLAQLYFIQQERVGGSESKLNNAYGLILAADALLTPLLVVIRHKHLKSIAAKRIEKELQQKGMSSEEVMKRFKQAWQVDT